MIPAILVDDEKAGRSNLKVLLGKYCPQVKIVAEAENPRQAQTAISDHNPQLVFLDVEMPHGSAFDLLAQYEQIPFEVIFVTAYDKYAIKAIHLSACDYILLFTRCFALIKTSKCQLTIKLLPCFVFLKILLFLYQYYLTA